jgi:hypothetical protein
MCKVKEDMFVPYEDLVNEHYAVAHTAQAMNASHNGNIGNGAQHNANQMGGQAYHQRDLTGTMPHGVQQGTYIRGPGGITWHPNEIRTGDPGAPAGTVVANGQPVVITHNNSGAQSTVKMVNGVITEVKTEGIKHDNEKPDLSLLPREFLDEVAKAMMYGEKKYGRYNFTGGMAWHRIISACLRHVTAFAGGEDNDQESGVSHLGHAGACILMLCVYFKRNLGTDTREKK